MGSRRIPGARSPAAGTPVGSRNPRSRDLRHASPRDGVGIGIAVFDRLHECRALPIQETLAPREGRRRMRPPTFSMPAPRRSCVQDCQARDHAHSRRTGSPFLTCFHSPACVTVESMTDLGYQCRARNQVRYGCTQAARDSAWWRRRSSVSLGVSLTGCSATQLAELSCIFATPADHE
jgi:hypothetical protein